MITRSILSMDSIPRAKRVGALCEVLYDLFFRLELTTDRDHPPSGNVRSVAMGDITIAESLRYQSTVTRTKSSASHECHDYIAFAIPMVGSVSFCAGDADARLTYGQGVAFHSGRPYAISAEDSTYAIHLRVPGGIIRERVRNIDDLCFAPSRLNPLLVPVVGQFALQLLNFDPGQSATEMESALIDLICLMMENNGAAPVSGATRRALTDVTFDRLMGYLRIHFADQALTPAKVADVHRISVRTLHHVFRQHGLAFCKVLQDIRLDEAHRLLSAAEETRGRPAVGDIAFRCGFVNQAHFATRFRENFGVTPRSVLANGGGAMSGGHSPE